MDQANYSKKLTKNRHEGKKIKIFFDFPTLFGKKGGAFF